MSQVRERVPPQNLEAEQAVIGSMLIEANAVVSALEILRPEDFYKESHRIIFKQIAEMADRLEAVDVVTVAENLRNAGYLDKIGGTAELARLANFVPTAANVEYYAKIVAEKAILRRLIAASTEIAATAYDSQYEVDEILDKAEETIFQISQRRATQGYVHLKDVLVETMEKLEYLASHKGNVVGLSSGFSDLDYLTSGFQPSDLIILAARPAVGKTSLGLNIARNVAIREDCPVAIFSLEMSREQVAQRLLCSEAAINSQKLRSGFLTDDEWRRLSIALGRLSEAKIFIDDTPGISVMEVRAKARRIKAEHGLGLVVVDYLQLMRTRKQENRQQEISEISRSLKGLARELDVPIIAMSQLSRAVEQRQDRRPVLSDLRESGAIEQDADVVIFLYTEPELEQNNAIELNVAKQRNGPTGSLKLFFSREICRFGDLDVIHAPGDSM
ncbi:MAG TPA: replicative DNA helicase [Bacillota bacterium]|nr:replicative DNA helicase [Bacillota bacterium]HOK64860.1 replicative DNA helicase [Bacillota bacterium]HOL12597.1 replicative DNA helicase [Bacillota bacterium]HOQ03319.1 replicative DNA helicase [Bacillota bacterium]HPP61012.1 replicative DNA helicase [Bacillota bacterium]